MFLKTHCLPLFITLISLFSSCFCIYREDPFHIGFRQGHAYHRPRTYHPYFGTFGFSNQRNYYNPNSANLFNYNNEIWSRLDTARAPVTLKVDDFGALANGRDDSEAFKKAWKYACSSSQGAILVVPQNKIYRLKPIDFSGPCKSALVLKIYGTIEATVDHSDYKKNRRQWLYFDNVQNLRVEGEGVINGNGRTWWQKSCKINKALPCQEAPTAVTFNECINLRVAGLQIKNAQQMHLTFQKCVNVQAFNLYVTAPGNSPNTDGIHVTETQNININNCVISTGDDCISIVSGSKNVRATGITCGPGHGISIGSLGARNSAAYVSNVIVNKATLSGTANGVRIKTWQGGSGYAKNIKFQNIVMHNVSNPIIIDQNYCDRQKPCSKQVSAVQVSNVLYQNIRGTSASNVAMKFDCSRSFPCQGIFLQDVALRPQEEDIAEASCSNVRLSYIGNVSPPCSS
ncbi:polygalacturonase QRT2-like [Durio zibethinus]|uniref:endo-polygalacturonase n=1 Tax=Durio zibethinus TaxID=66656 RepID=A0A6P5Y3G8_DURZI|nr:polygalacturonase QRT2-like [Durio zibethinus]